MRWRLLAAVGLVVIGIGAVGLSVFGPALAANDGSDYLTAPASRTDVVDQAVADGTIEAVSTYGVNFGSHPRIVDGEADSPADGGTTWLVDEVKASVGQSVEAGDILATADTIEAQAAVDLAQVNVDAAQARYDADSGGVTATDEESAQISVEQAEQQLAGALESRDETLRENRIRIDQSEEAVADAQDQLADDRHDDAPDAVIEADKQALAQAKDSLRLLQAQVAAQNRQARDQVNAAQLALDMALNDYESRTEPASAEVLATDRASLLQAERQLADAEADFEAATLHSPVDGVVVAVNLVAGTTAPSGDAIQVMAVGMQVTAEIAESDLPNLALGQAASLTVTATGDVLTGTVTAINPVASSAESGIATYGVTIALGEMPESVKPGMTAEVAITIAEAKAVIAVPSTALEGSAGNYSVQVLATDGTASRRPVDVGLVTNSLAEIKSGVAEGEQVVIGTTSSLNSTGGQGGGGFFPPGARPIPGGGEVRIERAP